MADDNNPASTSSDDDDPQVQRLLGYLREGPLANPPAHAVRRVKGMMPIQQQEPASHMFQQVIEMVATLIFDSRAAPALAGFRGGGGGDAHLIYECEAGEIDIQIQPGANGQRSRILAQIGSERPATSAQLCYASGTQVASAPVDDHGMFAFDLESAGPRASDSPRAVYDLFITLETGTIKVPSLEL